MVISYPKQPYYHHRCQKKSRIRRTRTKDDECHLRYKVVVRSSKKNNSNHFRSVCVPSLILFKLLLLQLLLSMNCFSIIPLLLLQQVPIICVEASYNNKKKNVQQLHDAAATTATSSSSVLLKPSLLHRRRKMLPFNLFDDDHSKQQQQGSSSSSSRSSTSALFVSNNNKETTNEKYLTKTSNASFQQRSFTTTTTTVLNNKKRRPWVNGLKNGLCSAGAAACSKTILQPIDAIKTMQQYHRSTVLSSTSTSSSLSLFGACTEIMKRPGGISNFYNGLLVSVIGAMPSVALYFGVYSYCKETFLQTKMGQENKLIAIATSAAIGNTVASFSRVPYEVLKQQLQTGMYTSTWDAIVAVGTSKNNEIWNLIFPKGGIAIQMIRDIPYAIVTLLVYESLRSKFQSQQQSHPPPSTITTTTKHQKQPSSPNNNNNTTTISTTAKKTKMIDFLLGGIAGGVGSYVTNPMDVVKTRLQTNSIDYQGSVTICSQMIYQEGGYSAFLRGSIPRLVHKIPANAFFFMFYELFRKVLQVE